MTDITEDGPYGASATRAKRLHMTKAHLVDIIEGLEKESAEQLESYQNFMFTIKYDGNQPLFEQLMDWARNDSWDIPSALMVICDHSIAETNDGDFFMHRSQYWDNDWSAIDEHFKTVHDLDLASPSINWSFDT
jgi:hypothetical protein